MKKKTSKSFHKCERQHLEKSHFDILISEIRNLKKDVEELKIFMNKSKGTLAVLIFVSGLVATIIMALDYFKK
jgi:hypothetical protein